MTIELVYGRYNRHQHRQLHHSHNYDPSNARLPQDYNGADKDKTHLAKAGFVPKKRRDATAVEVVQTIFVVKFINETGALVASTTVHPTTSQSPQEIRASSSVGFIVFANVATAIPSADSGISTGDDGSASSTWRQSATFWPPITPTSAPLPTSSTTFLFLTRVANSSISKSASHFPNSSSSTTTFFTNLTSSSSPLNSTISTTFSSFPSSSNLNTAFSFTTSTISVLATVTNGKTFGAGEAGLNGGNGGLATANTNSAVVSKTSSGGDGFGLTRAQSSMIGGMIGGLAGITLLIVILFYIVKWQKTHGNSMQLLGDGENPSSVSRALPSRPAGGGDSGMAQRPAVLLPVPSALVRLMDHKKGSQRRFFGGSSGEKGFHRVSGKKLTSVLESGGDGYTEPERDSNKNAGRDSISGRESIVRGSFYRGSQGIYGGPGSPRLQLGLPMRPVSGVPVFRESPARTPLQQEGPFFTDAPDRLRSPHLSLQTTTDSLGRSRVSQDGLRTSSACFTEVF